jgi:hypothetical protein
VPLNGHVAGEYLLGARWSVIDGDQNAVYLQLDNRTPASAEDLRADPFLAVRTKIFGKYAAMNVLHSRYNASLFEYVTPGEAKPFKFKREAAPPIIGDTLYPGEKLILHYDRPPEQAVGRTNLDEWRGVKEAALVEVELVVNAGARPALRGRAVIETAAPITHALNHTTGERVAASGDEPLFRIEVPVQSAQDRVSVFAQRARISLPPFRRGTNQLTLRGSNGGAKVTVEYDSHGELQLPRVSVASSGRVISAAGLRFPITTSSAPEMIWWQVADDVSFSFVGPNLEGIVKDTAEVVLDPLTATFLSPRRPYHFRCKAKCGGLWSEWSEVFTFEAGKPSAPAAIAAKAAPGGGVQLQWRREEGVEYLVFGSNRLDFLPELYAPEEVVRLHKLKVVESRPNKNLLATTSDGGVTFPAAHHFYRIVARRGEELSTPSAIVQAPLEARAQLAPARVLQMRAGRVPDAQAPNGYRDEYRAEERELPAR